MQFTPRNALGATVYDVDTKKKISRVLEVDIDAASLVCIDEPLRAGPDGDLITSTLRFVTIHPIYGGARQPVLFHCYGRNHG